jgi:hypothetical protein
MSSTLGGGRAPSLQVSEEKYSATVHQGVMGTRVSFRGTISTPNPAAVLNPFVEAVHAQLVQAGARDVQVDFSELEFCNSSGFKSFVHWLQLIQKQPEPKRYKLRFLSNPARKWQRTSLLALSCFEPSGVEIA